jgi:hypothetical protein
MPTLTELKSSNLRRRIWWIAGLLAALVVVGLILGWDLLRELGRGVGLVMAVVGALLTHTAKWDDHGPREMKRGMMVCGLFLIGILLMKFA